MVLFSEKPARPVAGLCLAVSRSVLIKQDGGRHGITRITDATRAGRDLIPLGFNRSRPRLGDDLGDRCRNRPTRDPAREQATAQKRPFERTVAMHATSAEACRLAGRIKARDGGSS